MRLIFVRHGLSVTNNSGRYTGQMDVPLAEKGYEEAACTAKYVLENYKVDAVYSSDSQRAHNTVKPIADALGLPVTTTEALREIDVGVWAGMLIETVKETYTEDHRRFKELPDLHAPTGGETYTQVGARAMAKLLEIVSTHHAEETVVIGTHGGTLRALFRQFLNLPSANDFPLVANASVSVVDYENGMFTVVEANVHGHLSDLKETLGE